MEKIWTNQSSFLVSSTKPPFNFIQRWVSRWVWTTWLSSFFILEGSGDLPYTPWRTLSETGWDFQQDYPDKKKDLDAFLLGLAVHIRDRDTLASSVEWAYRNMDAFDKFVANHK